VKNKKVTYTLSVATLALLMQSTPVFASPVTQGQINDTQLQIETLNTKIQQLDNQISIAMENSQKLNDEIKVQERKIEESKKEIAEAQKSFDAHQAIYVERLRVMQLQGQSTVMTYAEILFSSKGLSDFISRANAVSTILESDTDLLNSLQEKEKELAESKEKLESQMKELKDKQGQLALEQKNIEESKKEIQKQLDQSKNTLAKQENKLAEQKAQEQARLQAEEQARLLAQQQAQQVQQSLLVSKVESKTANLTYSSDKAQAVIGMAKNYMGVPYVWGGTTPNGFDCSGFTSYVFRNAVGIELPRVSRDQQNFGTRIATNQVQPGDLVFKGFPAYHVGIYIGGGKYIHAPQTGDVVKISSYNASSFSSASRILN
jgi:peptidoglycan DL-endopeptidase CwlO